MLLINRDQIQGRLMTARGLMKRALGWASLNTLMQADGELDRMAGLQQARFGDACWRVARPASRRRSIRRWPGWCSRSRSWAAPGPITASLAWPT